MTILNDKEIIFYARHEGMLSPFVETLVSEVEGRKVISYGLSSMGYDLRCAPEFKTLNTRLCRTRILDPTNLDEFEFNSVYDSRCIIPANSMILTRSVEYIKMPRDVTGICVGKSTYARVGVIANVTPLEAEWEGYLVIELSNSMPVPVLIHANQGICQILFFRGNPPKTSYADRKGKYQYQKDIVLSKV